MSFPPTKHDDQRSKVSSASSKRTPKRPKRPTHHSHRKNRKAGQKKPEYLVSGTQCRRTAGRLAIGSVSRKTSRPKLSKIPPQIKALSQNLQGDKRREKIETLINVMRDHKHDIACIQETHLPGTYEKYISEFYFMHHGPESQAGTRGSGGVGIILSPRAFKAWKEAGQEAPHLSGIIAGTTRFIGTTLRFIDQNEKPMDIFISSIYHPSDKSNPSENATNITTFHSKITSIFQSLPSNVTIISGGDINAKVGNCTSNSTLDTSRIGARKIIGKFNNKKFNVKGNALLEFHDDNKLCLANTFFQHKRFNTYLDPKGIWHSYDFWAVSQNALKAVLDAKVTNLGVHSDHAAIQITFRIANSFGPKRAKNHRAPKIPKIDWRLLRDPARKLAFNEAVKTTVFESEKSSDNKISYNDFNKAILISAQENLTIRRNRKDWFKLEKDILFEKIRLRNDAMTRKAKLPSEKNIINLRKARKQLKEAIKTAKRKYTEVLADEVEKCRLTHTKHGKAYARYKKSLRIIIVPPK